MKGAPTDAGPGGAVETLGSAPPEVSPTHQGNGLSPQEHRLLEAVARHGVVKLAARELGITLNTAYSYLKSARRKLGVTTTLEATWHTVNSHGDPTPDTPPTPDLR